jgi:hypothetical protein
MGPDDHPGQPAGEKLAGPSGIGCAQGSGEELDLDAERGEEVFDTVRDLVADLGLRLYALSSRHHSLDELFVQEAGR